MFNEEEEIVQFYLLFRINLNLFREYLKFIQKAKKYEIFIYNYQFDLLR